MAGSVSRVVAVMESLAAGQLEGQTAQEVVERSGLPASTGYRILTELQELGLVHRLGKRKMAPNFTFARRIRQSGLDPDLLADACEEISQRLTTASEVVLPREQSMLWHLVQQHDAQAIRLRAHPGFTRDAFELDSLSRLALAHLPVETIERSWDTSAFYRAGLDRTPMNWRETREMLAGIDPDGMQYDMMGNAKGIRRFCVSIRDAEGELACLLTVAEAAVPVRNEAEHAEAIRAVLMEQRARLEGGTETTDAAQTSAATTAR